MQGLRRMTLKAPSICTMEQKPLLAIVLSAVRHQLLWEWGFQSTYEKPVSLWKEWDRITRDGGSGSSRVSRCSKAMQLCGRNRLVFIHAIGCCIVWGNGGFLGCCQAYLQGWHIWGTLAWLDGIVGWAVFEWQTNTVCLLSRYTLPSSW